MADGKAQLITRFSNELISVALKDTPAVLVNGPRQCGKTTLVRNLLKRQRAYVTLDDETMLSAALHDPAQFISQYDSVAIDEVQRAPDLLRAIKKSIDEDRRPGRFLLTGSADLLTLPKISESLAGRMEIVTLLPLSLAEIADRKPRFLAMGFEGSMVKRFDIKRGTALLDEVVMGGYPQMRLLSNNLRRRNWARDYLAAIMQRDVRDVADIEKLTVLPRLLRALSHHAAQLVNFSRLGGELQLDDKTTRKYLGVLEQLFLIRRIEPWSNNRLSRMIKTPKVHFLDTGLLAAMSAFDARKVSQNRERYGALLETLVLSELLKQAGWYGDVEGIYYYRDKDKIEVDFVVEHLNGSILGIEVKASTAVTSKDFDGLRKLSAIVGSQFKLGVVLYDGEQVVKFGEGLFAAPLSVVWN